MSYSTLAVAAACVAPWGRLIVEYDHNQNHLGINTSGMPANLADNAVLVRGEVKFLMRIGIAGLLATWSLCTLSASACQWSSDSSSGLTSLMRVQGGQAMRGSISGQPSTIAATATLVPGNRTVFPGAPTSRSRGWWGPTSTRWRWACPVTMPTGWYPALTPENKNPHSFKYSARLFDCRPRWQAARCYSPTRMARRRCPSPVARAVDQAGNFGPASDSAAGAGPAGT